MWVRYPIWLESQAYLGAAPGGLATADGRAEKGKPRPPAIGFCPPRAQSDGRYKLRYGKRLEWLLPVALAASAAPTTCAPSTSPTAAATTTATAAFSDRPCFVDHQLAPEKFLAVQRLDRALSVLVRADFDEAEASRLA